MSWISDVVPYSTILSTWGNNIRNRIVQTFDSSAEMGSHQASLPDGSLATVAGDYMLYTKRGTFKPQVPLLCVGVPRAATVGAGYPGRPTINQVSIPAGYRTAIVLTSLRVSFLAQTTAGTIIQLRHRLGSANADFGYFDKHYISQMDLGVLDTLAFLSFVGISVNGDYVNGDIICSTPQYGGVTLGADQSNVLEAIAFP